MYDNDNSIKEIATNSTIIKIKVEHIVAINIWAVIEEVV